MKGVEEISMCLEEITRYLKIQLLHIWWDCKCHWNYEPFIVHKIYLQECSQEQKLQSTLECIEDILDTNTENL